MEYKLSSENESKKINIEEKIKEYDRQWAELDEEIENIRKNKELSEKDRNFGVREKEIQQEEISMLIEDAKQRIEDIYVKEMKENLERKFKNKEITNAEYAEQKLKIKKYEPMRDSKNTIDSFVAENMILEMKLSLENLKKLQNRISNEEYEKNTKEIKEEINANKSEIEFEKEYLGNNYLDYDKKILYETYINMKENGEISEKESQEKINALLDLKPKSETQIGKELKEMFNDLTKQNLEKFQRAQSYERERSSRTAENKEGKQINEALKQDINKSHDDRVYIKTDNFKDAPDVLAKKYSRDFNKEETELAEEFAKLEDEGLYNDWVNPYTGEEYDGENNPKYLLQFEKVKGLDIEGKEKNDTLKNDIYVATYEIWDCGEYSPIKEYFIKDENNEMIQIGQGTEDYTKFNVEGLDEEYYENGLIKQGESINKVTQKQLYDNLIKSNIEESLGLKNQKVENVSSINDNKFLKDFAKQCGLENAVLENNTYIVSTMDENGKENFELLFGSNGSYSRLENAKDFDIKSIQNDKEEINSIEGIVPGKYGAIQMENVENKKEYATKDGHRYSITKDKDGNLGFHEIIKENEKYIDAEEVGTNSLVNSYKNSKINQEDLNKSYNIINRTKEEREQTQDKTEPNKFEGR
jgi:hypothetical protein